MISWADILAMLVTIAALHWRTTPLMFLAGCAWLLAVAVSYGLV